MFNLALDAALVVGDVEVSRLGEEEDPKGETQGNDGLANEADHDLSRQWLS